MINWKISKQDAALVSQITERALIKGLYDNARVCSMDITAVHCNGNPLRLDEMLAASTGTMHHVSDFSHDILGIRKHIDRNTGKLLDSFIPRFSA